MSAFPELIIGPQDPDSTSELTRKLGTHNKVDRLLQRHGANYPEGLRVALARPEDEDRSAALDEDEVREYALSLKGRKAFLDEDDEIESLSVRGSRDKERVVAILYRTAKSGRSARAVIPYADLPRSTQAYEEAKEEAERKEAGGQVVTVSGSGVSDEQLAEQQRAAEAAARAAEAAETRAREAEAAKNDLAASLEELKDRLAAIEDAEPFDGYDDEDATELVKRVKEGGVVEFGTVGLQKIVDYEKEHKKRSTVIGAAETAIAAAG